MANNLTAVEWLINEIPNIDWENSYWRNKIEQAKEMEKQQIIYAYESGIEEGKDRYSSDEYNLEYYETAEQYYNQKFNK
jgi:hypothetical protein